MEKQPHSSQPQPEEEISPELQAIMDETWLTPGQVARGVTKLEWARYTLALRQLHERDLRFEELVTYHVGMSREEFDSRAAELGRMCRGEWSAESEAQPNA